MRTCTCPVGTYVTPIGTISCPESFGQVQKLIFQRANQTAGLGTTNEPSYSSTADFKAIFFADSIHGFIVGSDGTIMASVNSGVDWSAQTSGTTEDLNDVYFASGSIGYAVGENGTILKTTDAGTTWGLLTSGTTEDLNAVWFTDATTGFVVGSNGTILKTTDGSSWVAQTSGTTEELNAITYGGATNNFYVVGTNGAMLKTTNGGTNWSILNVVQYIDWQCVTYFDDDGTISVYAGAPLGQIYKTVDGGTNWTSEDTNIATTITDIAFYGVSGAFIGHAVASGGKITSIADAAAGSTWTEQTSSTTEDLYSIFSYGTSAFAVGDTGIIDITYDSGTTWTDSTINTVPEPTIKSLATWTALIAATDSTKVVVTPYITGFVPETGKQREFGSGNEVKDGIPIAFGTLPTKVACKIYEPTSAILASLKELECETLEVTFVNELGYYGHAGTSSVVHGFQVQSYFVSDRYLGGFDAPDYAEIMFSMPANWSENFTITAPDDHSGLELNG